MKKAAKVPKGKFILKSYSEKDRYSVHIQYCFRGKTIHRPVHDIVCRKGDWNPDGFNGRGELRACYGKTYQRINACMQESLNRYDAQLVEYNKEHPGLITYDVLRAILDNKPITRQDGGRDFSEFVLSLSKLRYESRKISYSRHENAVSNMKQFAKFLKQEKLGTYKPDAIYLGDITPEIVTKYIQWRREFGGNKDVTINHALTPIIQACCKASDSGFIKHTIYSDIKDLRIAIKPSQIEEESKFDGLYLSDDELRLVNQMTKNVKEPRRKEYLEMFMFSLHACGLRIIDVMTLKWRHVDFDKQQIRKILVKTAKATGKASIVPLDDYAVDILRRWKDKTGKSEFVFGLLPNGFKVDDEEALYKRRNAVTRSINQSLRVVGDNLHLHIPLTMHKARHTWAMIALNHGTSMQKVSQLLGHKSQAVTEKVYASYLPKNLADDVNKLNGIMRNILSEQ